MLIKDIQINGFGNLHDKNIKLEKGLNIIKGKNESGKSTLTNFIKCMFYGISKNKDGNKFSDFERFKPWADIPFGGQITYNIDDSEYTVFRDFAKNSSKVYDCESNEITKEFNKDRSRGVEIGQAHLKIDEDTFINSFLVRQSGVEVENQEQRTIIQKLTNIIQLGEENLSFEKIKTKLEKMLTDEVGTSRTQSKPINIVNREITTFTQMKDSLIKNKNRSTDINDELKKIKDKQESTARANVEAKKVYEVKSRYESLLEEKRSAYETAQKLLKKEKEEYQKKKKSKLTTGIISIVVIFTILVIALIIMKQYIYSAISAVLALCFSFLYVQIEKKDERTFTDLNFDVIKEELNKKEQKELQTLEKEGVKGSLLERKTASLKELIDGYEKRQNELTLEEHKLQLEKESLKGDVIKLNEIEESLQGSIMKKEELLKLESSIKLAIQVLDESYDDIKKDIIPSITRLIQLDVGKTTNGKYTNVIYNDANGLLVKNDNGEVITIDKLSIGSIDQIYLGFRLAIANKLENIPLVLDEPFVYYDNERLTNILETIEEISKEKQIIILTCSDREIDILKNKGKEINIIEI